MKRLILTLAAAAAIAAPMSAITATQASAQPRDHYDRRGDDGGHDRDDRRGDDRGHDRGQHQGRWDGRRDNGYYVGERFHYGPPPAAYYGRPDFRPGYSRWERGGYLPQYYWGRDYAVSDYGRYGLHRPPYGYRWYNVNGDYVLAAIAGGLIADALIH
jgi:Ni/Co efflux regulator RcnB